MGRREVGVLEYINASVSLHMRSLRIQRAGATAEHVRYAHVFPRYAPCRPCPHPRSSLHRKASSGLLRDNDIGDILAKLRIT